MSNLHVLLIYGGQSSEHEVSIASARNVFTSLESLRYNVSICYIDRTGIWWLVDEVDDYRKPFGPKLLPMPGQKAFQSVPAGKTVKPDVLFPVLHGKKGEDGTIQGLAEMVGIPYVGPGLLGAALTMDKDLTKRVLRQSGIPVVEDIVWKIDQGRPTYESVSAVLGAELFIKPARSGSSVGVSRAIDEVSFSAALDLASQHDEKVLIEKAVNGREIELAVMGNGYGRVSTPGEVIPGAEFYDYDDKYNAASAAQIRIPAELDPDLAKALRKLAARAYQACEGRGMARIDFFVTTDGRVYLNEINSIPGFTNISMYPKMWLYDGINYPDLVERLINLALDR